MKRDRRAGMTQRQIAEKYGVSKGRVEWWVVRKYRERPLTPFLERQRERREQVLVLLSRGVDIKRVARKVGMGYHAVWSMGRRHGIKRRTEILRDRAAAWMKQKLTGIAFAEIARREGLPETTVRSAVERLKKRNSGFGSEQRRCPIEATGGIDKPASVESTIRSETGL